MNKRLLSLFLTLCILCTAVIPAAAASSLPFSDVPSTAWYYENLTYAYNNGLINGRESTVFAPNDFMTSAEAVKLAVCMNQLYNDGQITITNGYAHWYSTYVEYAKAENIISKDYDWNKTITRAEYMEIFASALPDTALEKINNIPNNSIPDVSMDHAQASAIYTLYRAGIVNGTDDNYSCNPSSNINRAEVAAILSRMMNEDARINFTTVDNNSTSVIVTPDTGNGETGDDNGEEDNNETDTPAPVEGTVIYVDADAADNGTGSLAAPCNTIQAAIEAARTMNANMADDITIYIRNGEYFVEDTIELTTADSGSNGHKIIYKAESITGVRIYGAEKLTGWTEHGNGVWKVPVDHEFFTLYENDTRAIKARYPNKEVNNDFITSYGSYLRTIDSVSGNNNKNYDYIEYNTSDLAGISFSDITDANIVLSPWDSHDWAMYTLKIESIDTSAGRITPNYRGEEGDNKAGANYDAGCRYYIEGMLELLDVAGEFHYDSDEQMLYYKPLHGGNPNEDIDVYAPVTDQIITINGAENITFDGLSFEKTDFIRSMKIWYNHIDTVRGAVTLENAENITITNCRFKNTGMSGVYMVGEKTHYNTVENCLFEDIGISGVIIRSTKRTDSQYDGSGMTYNTVRNCIMHDLGQTAYDCAGVNIYTAQNTTVENLEIYNSPRYAVSVRGQSWNGATEGDNLTESGLSKNNIVRNCLVYQTNQNSGDTGSVHSAGLSFPGENGNTNYFENIYIDNTYAEETMLDLKPNGIFGDYHSNHQSYSNIRITNCDGATNDVTAEAFSDFYQFRMNDTDASTCVYDNVSWVRGFDHDELDYAAMGITSEYPFELFPDYELMKDALIMQTGSSRAINHGVSEDMDAEVVLLNGGTYIPAAYLSTVIGTNVTGDMIDGTNMVLTSAIEALGYIVEKYDGLIIITQTANLFEANYDHMTIKRLGNYLFDNFQASNFKYDTVIPSKYYDYTATGTELADGESYMIRTAGSKNAGYIAVEKNGVNARLVVRLDGYAIPTFTDLNTSGSNIQFVKSGTTLKVIVDDSEVYCAENTFDAVYLGTYTTGTNTLTLSDSSLSIAPAEPSSMSISISRPELVLGSETKCTVTLTDKTGNTYDVTELVTISADSAIVTVVDGMVTASDTGVVALTAAATINGQEMSASKSFYAVKEGSILLEESFDVETLPSDWTTKNENQENGSYAKIVNHRLEIYNNWTSSDNKTVEASRPFDAYTGKIALEFDFTPTFTPTAAGANIHLKNQSNQSSVSLMVYQNKVSYHNGTKVINNTDVTITSGTTHKFKVVADTDTDTYDVLIDGVKVFDDIPFRFNATSLNSIMLGTTSKCQGAIMCWDNIVVSKATTEYLKESFDDEVLSSYWGTKNTDETSYVRINSDHQLEIHADGDDGNPAIEAWHSFDALSGTIVAECDFKVSELGSGSGAGVLYLNDSQNKLVVSTFAYADKFGIYTGNRELGTNGWFYSDTGITVGTTYRIKVVADTSTDMLDMYVDGVQLFDDVPFRKQVDSLANFFVCVTSNSKNTTACWDNIVVYTE